jgi:hypothetical protein
MSCSDGDLLFDSTSSDFTFILGNGSVIAEKANTISNPIGLTVVSTRIPVPLVPGETDKYETPYIEWSLLHKVSSIDPMTTSSEYVSVPPQIALGGDMGKPSNITSDMNMDIIAKQNTGYFLMASTYEVDPLYVPAGRGFDGTHHWVSGDAGELVPPTPPATTRASYTLISSVIQTFNINLSGTPPTSSGFNIFGIAAQGVQALILVDGTEVWVGADDGTIYRYDSSTKALLVCRGS